MIDRIDPEMLPRGSRIYLDYISGKGRAAGFFTHGPLHFSAALSSREGYPFPRKEMARSLEEYNSLLAAYPSAIKNARSLADPSSFCVITGQQAGFFGGPVYTFYKIITAIRLAEHLQEALSKRFVPVLWLATEDHDLSEANRAFFLKADGEVGVVKFAWEKEGHPISDLPVNDELKRAHREYFECLAAGRAFSHAKELFSFKENEDFCTWNARIWSNLFSPRGLLIVEPRIVRPLAKEFFQFVLGNREEIRSRLEEVSQRLSAAGYTPSVTSPKAGTLYTFDPGGRRIRIDLPQEHLREAAVHPERYSTDAVLRPLLADTLFPVAASVLGPGEIAYHAHLKPLYELFRVPQPVLFPRKSCTIVARDEAELLQRYRIGVEAILTGNLEIDAAFRSLAPEPVLKIFSSARRDLEAALSSLGPFLERIDPGLKITWQQTVSNSLRNLERLEERAIKAQMSRQGFSKRDLRGLCSALLPRGRLQERVFPLPHFISRHGKGFVERVISAGPLDDFSHRIIILEGEHA